jgi:hypothetical protein
VVAALLEDKGLVVVRVPGAALPAGDPRLNTVYEAAPLGSLAVGTPVTITFYIEDTTQSAPSN